MIMTHSQRPRGLLGFRRSVAPAVSAMIVALVCSGLVSVRGGDGRVRAALRRRGPVGDRARRSAPRRPGAKPSCPSRSPGRAAAAEEMEGVERAPDSSRTPRTSPPRARASPSRLRPASAPGRCPKAATTGYRSNSWRQGRRDPVPALSFSSGVLAPSSGLDAACRRRGSPSPLKAVHSCTASCC